MTKHECRIPAYSDFLRCDWRVRDGGKATDYIDRALEQRPNDLELWNTCAAVLAENGDFDGAIEREKACIDSREIPEEQTCDCEKRLTVYERHRPYRDEPESASSQLGPLATERRKWFVGRPLPKKSIDSSVKSFLIEK